MPNIIGDHPELIFLKLERSKLKLNFQLLYCSVVSAENTEAGRPFHRGMVCRIKYKRRTVGICQVSCVLRVVST